MGLCPSPSPPWSSVSDSPISGTWCTCSLTPFRRFWIQPFDRYNVDLGTGGVCQQIVSGSAAVNTEYPIVDTLVYATTDKEWNTYHLKVRLAHAKEYKRYTPNGLVSVPVANGENVRLIVELRDPNIIDCATGADFCSRKEFEVLPGVVPSVTIINLDTGFSSFFPGMLAYYGGFHHYGVNAKKPEAAGGSGCLQVNQNLGSAVWSPASESALVFESPWLPLASPQVSYLRAPCLRVHARSLSEGRPLAQGVIMAALRPWCCCCTPPLPQCYSNFQCAITPGASLPRTTVTSGDAMTRGASITPGAPEVIVALKVTTDPGVMVSMGCR